MYTIGENRLWYNSTTSSGTLVVLDILQPDLKRNEPIQMIPFDDVFYADVIFYMCGSHYMRIFENGVFKHKAVLLVSEPDLILYPNN